MIDFKKEIKKILRKHTKSEIILEIPPNPELGDFAFPCFALAKEFKKAPNQIAEELVKKIPLDQNIVKIEVKGPYVNFFVNKQKLAESVINAIQKEKGKYGKQPKKKEKVMVEYSSPNTNKAQHLGHIRNNLIGLSVSNLLDFSGFKVIKTCLMNDRGMGVSKSMLAYKLWGKNKKPNKKPDKFVAEFYTMFGKKVKEKPELEDQAKELLLKWESGDKETVKLWRKMNKWVYQGYDETYKKLGCKFDKIYYESNVFKEGKDIVLNGLKKGIFKKDDGAIVADLEDFKLGKKVLIKSDGTALYMTQDLYLAKKKFDDFKLDKSIYVVANEQDMHFKQLFKILNILKFKWAKQCYHLSYGMIDLPSGKMKSREGTIVEADELIAETIELARKGIMERHKDISKKEVEKRAEIIGLGALKFFILKFDTNKGFTFNPKESISFEGETGPYLQYTHARICSILRRYGKKPSKKVDYSKLEEKGFLLAKKLKQFPDVVDDSAKHYKPSIVCRYLLDLAQQFNEFYHACPVLKADEETKKARILLIDCVKQVISNGLDLLAIEAPERM